MTYVLNALIADLDLLPHARDEVVPLPQGKGLAPLTGAFWRDHGGLSQPILRGWEARNAPPDDFNAATERQERIDQASTAFDAIAAICAQVSGPVVYVEAEYWAGEGAQAAAAWDRGQPTLAALVAPDAINQALRLIGVSTGGPAAEDEFDALGLGRCRMTDEWLKTVEKTP